MNVTRAVCVLLALLLAVAAFGQIMTGSMVGTVTSDGSALPGVTISVSSPNMQGTRTAVTGDAGGFFLPNLPPGTYKVRFELTGMQPAVKTITVNVSQTSRADATLRVAAVTEAINVTAAAPVAAETSEVSANFSIQQVNELPIGRTITDVVTLAPGVTEAGPGNQVTISGSMSYDNLYLVNGVVIADTLRSQPMPLYVEDAVQETTVLTSGISAEFGRFTGGVVSTITKSGGNEFSGSLRDSLTNESWRAKSAYAQEPARLDQLNNVYEATFGGRIIRDRLWFFGSGRYNSAETSRATTQTLIPYVSTTDDKRFEGKLTGAITPKQSFTGTYTKTKLNTDNFISSGTIVDLRSLTFFDRPRSLLSLNYSNVLTNSFLVEGQFSRMNDKYWNGALTRDLIDGTILLDSANGRRMWSPTFCGVCAPKQRDNKGWLAKGSYFISTRSTGNHNIIGGIEEFHLLRKEDNYQSGSDFRIHGTMLCNVNGVAVACSKVPTSTPLSSTEVRFGTDNDAGQIEWDPIPATSAGADFLTRSAFLNDKWDFNSRFSFNVGLRYDKASGQDQAGHTTVDDSAFSPRLGAIYDVKGDGQHRFSASYSQYVSKVESGPADNAATAGRYASYYWNYKGPVINSPGTAWDKLVPTEQVIRQVFDWFQSVGGTNNSPYLDSVFIPGVSTRFDRPLAAPIMKEIRGGYAFTFANKGFVRADYITRNWDDFYVLTRTLQTGKATAPDGRTFDQGVIENSGDQLSRKYNAVQVQASYRLLTPLSIGGNYTYSKLRGNVEGETTNATSIESYYNYPEYTWFERNHPVGYLTPDMRHRGNVWLQYNLPTSYGRFNFSAFEHYHSALSYSAIGAIDVRATSSTGPANGVTNPGYVTPPSSVTYFFSDRGAYRMDNITATDLGVNYYMPPLRGARFFVEAELLNAFNQQGLEDPDSIDKTILARRNTTCLQTGTTTRCLAFNPFTETPVEGTHWQKGPNFGTPTSRFAYQLPRTYRVSFGVKF